MSLLFKDSRAEGAYREATSKLKPGFVTVKKKCVSCGTHKGLLGGKYIDPRKKHFCCSECKDCK